MTEATEPRRTDGLTDRSRAASQPSCSRVVVLDVVGLQPRHLDAGRTPTLDSLLGDDGATDLRPPFPAVTVPAQTTLATGRPPAVHGDVANGTYDRQRDAVTFWGRQRGNRTRLWEAASDDAGLTSGALCFQHLVGTSADVALTPSPIEDEDDELVEMDCWTNPDGLYDRLREAHGHFPLHRYWGPGANEESSEWILSAAGDVAERRDPDLLWVYVPHLDYVGQRAGPRSGSMDDAVAVVDDLLAEFVAGLRATERWSETAVAVLSEYGFHAVDRPTFPNRALRDAGLLTVEDDGDVDLSASSAFAMVDHQVAHVYAAPGALADARAALAQLEGIDAILDRSDGAARGVDHRNAGDLVLVADRDAWFQYYWWTDDAEAPPYATDVDIHAKPGFDPCELFLGDDGFASTDPFQVGGSHGRVDPAAYGCFGLGGPAAPPGELPETVDATDVAPTIAALLGIRDDCSLAFDGAVVAGDAAGD